MSDTISPDSLVRVTVEGIEWRRKDRFPKGPAEVQEEGWECVAFPTFKVRNYPDRGIFRGWCATEVGCGIGLSDCDSRERAMTLVADRIRDYAAERLSRARAEVDNVAKRCEQIGVDT